MQNVLQPHLKAGIVEEVAMTERRLRSCASTLSDSVNCQLGRILLVIGCCQEEVGLGQRGCVNEVTTWLGDEA
jgi:hypothetical protein